MVTIDIEKLHLLDRFKYIPVSMNSENIGNLLLGKWNHFCSKNNYTGPNLLGSSFEFTDKYIIRRDGGPCSWSLHDYFEDGNKKIHPFIKTIRIRFPRSTFDYIDPVIIYIDEKIILLGTHGYYNYGQYKYKLTDICIKDDALDIFKTNDDILLYFSIIENHWENERYKMKNEISNYENKAYYIFILSIFIVLAIISVIIYNIYHSVWMLVGAIIGSIFITSAINTFLYDRIVTKKDIKKYQKNHSDNRLAQIITPKQLEAD